MKPFHVQGLRQLWQEEPDVYRTTEVSLLMGLNKQNCPVLHRLTPDGDTLNDSPLNFFHSTFTLFSVDLL